MTDIAMQKIDFTSRDNIEDSLWEIGLNFHNLSSSDRMFTLLNLKANKNRLMDSDIQNFAGYILHSYMIQMDDEEKRTLIDLLEDRFCQNINSHYEGLELLALLVKGCPTDYKQKLILSIVNHGSLENYTPSMIVSYTNAIRYIFDEADKVTQQSIYVSLHYLLDEIKFDFLKTTIQYTIDNIKTLH